MPNLAVTLAVLLVLYLLYELFRQLSKLNQVRRLIDTYEHDVENPRLIDEMFSYCTSDRKLKKVVEKHGATRERFDKIYHKLLVWGNFRKINRFVPISSFFAVYTLDYLLTHEDDDPYKLTKKMCNFFNI